MKNVIGLRVQSAKEVLGENVAVVHTDCGRDVHELREAEEHRVLRARKTESGYELVTGRFKG